MVGDLSRIVTVQDIAILIFVHDIEKPRVSNLTMLIRRTT